jgi:hypothetical protein
MNPARSSPSWGAADEDGTGLERHRAAFRSALLDCEDDRGLMNPSLSAVSLKLAARTAPIHGLKAAFRYPQEPIGVGQALRRT